jgi:hypothetical protein
LGFFALNTTTSLKIPGGLYRAEFSHSLGQLRTHAPQHNTAIIRNLVGGDQQRIWRPPAC